MACPGKLIQIKPYFYDTTSALIDHASDIMSDASTIAAVALSP